MTRVVYDQRDASEIVRELRIAICGKSDKDEVSNHAVYHEASNTLEVMEPKLFDTTEKEKKPLYSEEEIFAMARNQRRR